MKLGCVKINKFNTEHKTGQSISYAALGTARKRRP